MANVFATEPEILLKSQIDNAKCFSKCLNGKTVEERTLCFEICKLVQENPETDICKFPKLCTGACKTACEKQNVPSTKFASFSASKCEVKWSMDSEVRQNVVFVVAGLDLGGMWHLVFHNHRADFVIQPRYQILQAGDYCSWRKLCYGQGCSQLDRRIWRRL